MNSAITFLYSFILFTLAGLFGAFIRWLIFNRDKTYKDVLLRNLYQNSLLGVLIVGGLIVIYVNWIK